MPYEALNGEAKKQLQEFVSQALARYVTYHDAKENMALAGITLFLAAGATILVAKDWPSSFLSGTGSISIIALSLVWLLVSLYLRFQLRRRRWAALRVAGCEWLLAEWLPDSPKALANQSDMAVKRRPGWFIRAVDVAWPLKAAVAVMKPDTPSQVYPKEIEEAWLKAEWRGTEALSHERLIHFVGWVTYFAMVARTLIYPS